MSGLRELTRPQFLIGSIVIPILVGIPAYIAVFSDRTSPPDAAVPAAEAEARTGDVTSMGTAGMAALDMVALPGPDEGAGPPTTGPDPLSLSDLHGAEMAPTAAVDLAASAPGIDVPASGGGDLADVSSDDAPAEGPASPLSDDPMPNVRAEGPPAAGGAESADPMALPVSAATEAPDTGAPAASAVAAMIAPAAPSVLAEDVPDEGATPPPAPTRGDLHLTGGRFDGLCADLSGRAIIQAPLQQVVLAIDDGRELVLRLGEAKTLGEACAVSLTDFVRLATANRVTLEWSLTG